MLHQVEHELVVEQPDEVETAETGRAPQRQVSDDHGRVERPAEQELTGGGPKLGFTWQKEEDEGQLEEA